MELTGSYRIPAPRDVVWAGLNDPEILKASIPGCQSLEKLSDTELKATVVSKIGPVKASFSGAVTLENLNPPVSYTISGQGTGGAAGFAKGGADVSLAEEGAETVLTYTAKAQVGGKIAQLGSRLVDGVAKQTADAFFANFVREVTAKAGSPVAPPADAPPLADAPPMVHEEPVDAPTPVLDAPPLASGTVAPPPPPPADVAVAAPASHQADDAKTEREPVTSGSSNVGRILFVAAVVIVVGFVAYNLLWMTPS